MITAADVKKLRDIKACDMIKVLEKMLSQRKKEDKRKLFTDILSCLNVYVRKGAVALFVCLEEDYTSSATEVTFRFAHLTFQEFLAGRHIAQQLEAVAGEGLDAFRLELLLDQRVNLGHRGLQLLRRDKLRVEVGNARNSIPDDPLGFRRGRVFPLDH